MTWAKLDDGIYSHPKILRADLQAIGLYCLSLAYSACHELDGAVPAEAVAMLARGDERLAEQLVTLGLYEPQPFGYKIHDFLRYNPSARQVRKQRKEVKDRVVKYRARNALQTRISHALPRDGTGRVTASSGKGESEGKTPSADFATWYAAYPRKRGPEDARRAWEATRLARPPLADLLRVLGLQRASPDWVRDSGQFVPYPATYLRAHSWADDVGPPTVGTRPPEDLSAITVHPLAARLNARGKIEGHHG